ncbi:PepSY domain-containing protein [Chitinimonas sp.]|uniref:PepSY domain-containing protein n=1 Tax=Chitinimonas sp. TaxID=1934313 RepID=UPI0035B32D16
MNMLLTWLSCLALLISVDAYAKTSRDDAAAIAQRLTGGRVLSVDRAERDGHEVWRIKVVTPQGEVRIVLIDAESGKPL